MRLSIPTSARWKATPFEVEVNQRFPIFFSEKRPFFMEGLGLFNLAGTGGDSTMRTAVHTRKIVDPSAGLKLTGASGRHTFGVLSSADASPDGERQRVFTVAREVMNFGRGRYVGLLMSDTEFGRDHNRVVGGDVAFKTRRTFSGQRIVSHLAARAHWTGHRDAATAARRLTTTALAASRSPARPSITIAVSEWTPPSSTASALTRGWQYQALNFYPSHPRYKWIKRINPFLWVIRRGRSHAEEVPRFSTCRRFDSISRAPAICASTTARATRRSPAGSSRSGRTMIDGGAQITRWLNIGGGTQAGPAIFYDAEAPYQGDRRSVKRADRAAAERAGQQQHLIQLRDVQEPRDRRERVPRARPEPAEHVSVHAAILHARRRAVRFVAQAGAWRLSGVL